MQATTKETTAAAINIRMREIRGKKEQAKEPEIKEEPKPEPKAEPKPVNICSNYQMNRIIELLKSQNELLALLSNKLAFIVDELV